MSFLPTNDLKEILLLNISNRMKNVAKFYSWLEVNENTPIDTKLLVLDNCAFSALTYGCEAWGDVTCIAEKLIAVEIKLLKTILKIKKGTTNDIVFYELKRSNIISRIKDRQYRFFRKLLELPEHISIMKKILELCKDSSSIQYYTNLVGNNSEIYLRELNDRIHSGSSSMIEYYRNLVNPEMSCIYNCFINDYYRASITRWRVSNHKLGIETGRYKRPFLARQDRLCTSCNALDDEDHAIFKCPNLSDTRLKFNHLLVVNNTVKKTLLNPKYEYITETAKLLKEIDNQREKETGHSASGEGGGD